MEENLTTGSLVSVAELMGRKFRVPAYQRGYRWTKKEVTDLLEDLWEFHQSEPKKQQFYCLQPIVIQKNGEFYDVLDGQQRLTTLYLLLSYLDDRRREDGYSAPLFEISYASRPESQQFLAVGGFREASDGRNIDFAYMSSAYQTIKEWFELADPTDNSHQGAKGKLIPRLLDESGIGANVRFVYYEVGADEHPIQVFLRLNKGKIPLTDGELVKALLLQTDKYAALNEKDGVRVADEVKSRLDLIAAEWHKIETRLHESEFWGFLGVKLPGASHIDLLLRALAKSLPGDPTVDWDNPRNSHPAFIVLHNYIEQCLAEGNGQEPKSKARFRLEIVEQLWERVVMLFEILEVWWNDYEIYHQIGYLLHFVASEKRIFNWLQDFEKEGIVKFKQRLLGEISKSIKDPASLVYENAEGDKGDSDAIHSLLLLHNVHRTMQNPEKMRFPFHLFRKEKWELEHIYPQHPVIPEKWEERKEWLKNVSENVEKGIIAFPEELKSTIKELLNQTESNEEKGALDEHFQSILQAYLATPNAIDKAEDLHSVGNLCLLPKALNISVSNHPFAVKRNILRQKVGAAYIPIATREVFNKVFSAHPASYLYWEATDVQDYLKELCSTYHSYVPSKADNP